MNPSAFKSRPMTCFVVSTQGEFTLSVSVSASEALAAVGMDDTGLNVLTEGERRQLLDGVRGKIR